MSQDVSPLPPPVAIPAEPMASPTLPTERSVALDVLRGVAILGILLLNIRSFGLPMASYTTPFAWENPTQADLWVFGIIQTVADGKFMTLFAGLFGAGLVLSARRYDESGEHARAYRVQYRRLGWLAGFGLLHIFFLWHGDVLLLYAILGMVIFPVRRWPIAGLLALALGLMAVTTLLMFASWGLLQLAPADQVAEAFPPLGARVPADEVAAFTGSYASALVERIAFAATYQPLVVLLFGWHYTGVMLLGMVALRCGFLTGRLSTRIYQLITLVSLLFFTAAGILVVAGHRRQFIGPDWELIGFSLSTLISVGCATGIAALVQIAVKASPGGLFTTTMAAVGRMAFTNYLLQSLICTTIFYGYGLKQWGEHGYAPLLWFVLGVWAFEIILSTVWLSRFRFGPLEWLWRSLTYGRPVAMRWDPA